MCNEAPVDNFFATLQMKKKCLAFVMRKLLCVRRNVFNGLAGNLKK